MLTAQQCVGTCAPMALEDSDDFQQRGERLMLPCMCHGHASASAGTWDTPGEPHKGLDEHSTMAKLCASPSCGGDLSLAYKVQRLHQKCIYSIEMCVCEIL